jgi:hypothetical protein
MTEQRPYACACGGLGKTCTESESGKARARWCLTFTSLPRRLDRAHCDNTSEYDGLICTEEWTEKSGHMVRDGNGLRTRNNSREPASPAQRLLRPPVIIHSDEGEHLERLQSIERLVRAKYIALSRAKNTTAASDSTHGADKAYPKNWFESSTKCSILPRQAGCCGIGISWLLF